MSPFLLVPASVVAWLGVVATAYRLRGRLYATFAFVLLGLHTALSAAMLPAFARFWPVFAYLQLVTYLHFVFLVYPRMRGLAYRALVSMPASFFVAGTFLALPWALLAALGVRLPLPWLPYALALVGLLQSLFAFESEHDVSLDGAIVEEVRPIPHGSLRVDRPLRVVQISDPHLGPFMSVKKLAAICARAVAREPDLVLLTGDFLTMESQSDPRLLHDALAPLAALRGKVFACFGNHDHEAPEIVRAALAAHGIILLVDDSAVVDTPVGRLQIVGMDFSFRDREARLRAACRRHPRIPGVTRLVMLHDPGAIHALPEGEGDLVFSGHTHGGQVGLLSLGLPWTFLRLFGNRMPDHGFWGRGRDRLWVHRGTGHYGFPLRLGVPAEQSLLRVHFPKPAG